MFATEPTLDPETIRRTANEVLERSEFHVDQQTRGGDAVLDWIIQLLYWAITPFRWLFDAMEGLPDAFRWLIVIGLFLLLLLLLGHLVYTMFAALSPTTRKSGYQISDSTRVHDPEEIERWAQKALQEQDYIAAIRFLFRASLAHLQALEGRAFRPGLTNRGYLRRYRQSPLESSLRTFVDLIDACWYGNSPCQEDDYLSCRAAYVRIRKHREESAHAHDA